jgi:hypothetical protein
VLKINKRGKKSSCFKWNIITNVFSKFLLEFLHYLRLVYSQHRTKHDKGEILTNLKYSVSGLVSVVQSIIPATQGVEIRRIMAPGQPREKLVWAVWWCMPVTPAT